MAILEGNVGIEATADEPDPTSQHTLPPRHATRLDLSWKEGGSSFPRTTSRVGDEFQAIDLPSSETFAAEQAKTNVSVDLDRLVGEQEEDPKAL